VKQNCQLDTATTTYTAGPGASMLSDAKSGSLVSCFHEFDLGGGEPTVVVDSKGTVTYAPVFTAEGVGLARSSDEGATWTNVVPSLPEGRKQGRAQPYLFRDPSADRLFFLTTGTVFGNTSGSIPGFDMSASTDGFATLQYSNVAKETTDWIKLYAGPPVTSTPVGTKNVLYMSAPSPISTLSGVYQAVYKSTDAGSTWQAVGGKALSLKVADYADCPSDGWVIFGNGGVGPDGTVYISVHRCGHLAVAVSPDEGETWTITDVPGTTLLPFIGLIQEVTRANALLTEPLSVDSDGNVYLVWPDEAGALQLSVSKDKATTWSAPLVVAEPSVTFAVYGGTAVKAPGTLAISYYGSLGGQAGPFNGYIAETKNALDAAPVFQSIRVNDPDKPLMPEQFDVGYVRLFNGGDLNEIVKPVYAPNGDIWAGFSRDMCLTLGSATDANLCQWDVAAHTGSFFEAAVGRAVHR
jgi:hypothetical protein